MNHPGATKKAATAGGDGRVEEAREDPSVGAYVFEDGNGVESGLIVGLG